MPADFDSLRTPLTPRQVFKLVALTVAGTLPLWYVSAISSFAGNTYGFNNRFTEVAIRDHWWYLLWSNVVVLKGYFWSRLSSLCCFIRPSCFGISAWASPGGASSCAQPCSPC